MNRTFVPADADYPPELHEVPRPPPVTVDGEFDPAQLRVAIVGSREAIPISLDIAKRLAELVVSLGGVVVSGGAVGADRAAHDAALDAKGRTWAVLGCGPGELPKDEEVYFKAFQAKGGTLIRPFPPGTKPAQWTFTSRNRVLVALSHVVVVVQAGLRSGTLNSARWARDFERELWVVPGPCGKEFEGSWWILDHYKSRMLRSESAFAEALAGRLEEPDLDGDALRLFRALESGPKHPDELACETGLSTPAVTTALLTLALGDVVVEGSSGLFQRKKRVTG